jgi:hypothetical protein
MDRRHIAEWLRSLTEKQFVEFFYDYLAVRPAPVEATTCMHSHLALVEVSQTRDEHGMWSPSWEVELLCPSLHRIADDAPISRVGTHCGFVTLSWGKEAICSVCGGELQGS